MVKVIPVNDSIFKAMLCSKESGMGVAVLVFIFFLLRDIWKSLALDWHATRGAGSGICWGLGLVRGYVAERFRPSDPQRMAAASR